MERMGAMPFMISWVRTRLISVQLSTVAASSWGVMSSMVTMKRRSPVRVVKRVVRTARLPTVALSPGRSWVRMSERSGQSGRREETKARAGRRRRRSAAGLVRMMWPRVSATSMPVAVCETIDSK